MRKEEKSDLFVFLE